MQIKQKVNEKQSGGGLAVPFYMFPLYLAVVKNMESLSIMNSSRSKARRET